jgi:hypothetical protein
MLKDYKVYYNDSFVVISCNEAQRNENFDKVISDPQDVQNFLTQSGVLFNTSINETILLLHSNPTEAIHRLVQYADTIIAGGGIVFNEKDEVLLIYLLRR